DVADAGALDLDHVGAQPGEQLGAGRARLYVGEIENAHAVERLAVEAKRLGRGLGHAIAARAGSRPFRRRLALLGDKLDDPALAGRLLRDFLRGLGGLLFAAFRHRTFSLDLGACVFYFLRIALCGLRFPIRPLSVPAAGSIAALISVGLPESSAA